MLDSSSHSGAPCDAITTPAAPTGGYVPCGCRYGAGIEWLCVMTEFGQETTAERSIRDLGLCSWLPKHFAGGRARPLFPAYLFAQVDLNADPWQRIYRQPGVATVLGTYRERPTIVPPSALALLWADCAASGVIYPRPEMPPTRLPAIAQGAPVKLLDGPFASFAGICEKSDRDRVAILLTVMGREVRVWAARAAVE